MKGFDGRVTAITGAGSGIGRALAVELATRGAILAVSDVDAAALDDTVEQCLSLGAAATSQIVDVADRAAVEAWADAVMSDHGRVNLVVNNAGVALSSTVEAMSYEDFEWLMDINFWGVVHGTKAFLPYLKAGGDGHIVNLSSVFGLVSVPSQSAYNAAKFGVRGFTDSLRIELEIERCGVSATTVHPGGIKTNIVRNGRYDESAGRVGIGTGEDPDAFDAIARTGADDAARQILRAVERNRRRVLVGGDARIFDAAARLPAGIYQRLLVYNGRRR